MKKIIILLLAMLSVTGIKAQMIAAHTDIAWDALQAWNIGAELTLNNRSTLNLDGFYSKDPSWTEKGTKVVAVQPELRYYFGGRPMYHHFVGLSTIISKYQLNWKNTRHKGIAGGVGLNIGYAIPLSKRLVLDAHTGFGVLAIHDRKVDLQDESKWGYTIAPTKIGITLSYIIR